MTLPASGTISLLEIQTEFGGPGNLLSYYVYPSGEYVPDTSTNSAVPSSGPITMQDFYGTQNGSIVIISNIYSTTALDADNAGTQLNFYANGVLQFLSVQGTSATYTNVTGQWFVGGVGSPSDYQIIATVNSEIFSGSGSFTGPTGTWINLSTSPGWYVTAPEAHSTANANIHFQIRLTENDEVVGSANLVFLATALGTGDS